MGDAEFLAHKLEVLQRHCEDVGRDVAEIEFTAGCKPIIRDTEAEAQRVWEAQMAHNRTPMADVLDDDTFWVGTPELIAERMLGAQGARLPHVPRGDGRAVRRRVARALDRRGQAGGRRRRVTPGAVASAQNSATSFWNRVSWSPPGASSRELSDRHGVGVGGAMSVAPASVSRSVAAAASRTPNATRMWPATRRPTSTWSMCSACGTSDSSSVARPGVEDHDVPRAVVEGRELRQARACRGRTRTAVVVVLGRHHQPHLEHAIRHGRPSAERGGPGSGSVASGSSPAVPG